MSPSGEVSEQGLEWVLGPAGPPQGWWQCSSQTRTSLSGRNMVSGLGGCFLFSCSPQPSGFQEEIQTRHFCEMKCWFLLESEKFISSRQDMPRNKNLGWDHLDLLFLVGPQEHRGLGANGSEYLRLESLFQTRLVSLLVWCQPSFWYLPSTFLRISWDFLDFFDSLLSSPLLRWIVCFLCHLGGERVSP